MQVVENANETASGRQRGARRRGRWTRPAVSGFFFASTPDWESETRHLEGHVQRLLRGGEDVPAEPRREEAEQPAHTNKDLFRDRSEQVS